MHHITSLLLVFLPLLPAQTLTRGPSVWEHSASSFLVAFKTSAAATGQIEWGPTEALGNTTSGPSTTNHAIRITGLLPEHFYWYRVRLNSVAATPVYRTRTFASTGSDVSFFVFGDSGVGNANQLRVASLSGTVGATRTIAEQARTSLPMPFTFMQSQPSQMLAALSQHLAWQGDARFILCRDPRATLQLAQLECGAAGMLFGWVEEDRCTEWWRLLPAT